MAFCTKCGNQLRDGTTFCTRCGAPVHKAEEANASHNNSAGNESVGNGSSPKTEAKPNNTVGEEKKSKKQSSSGKATSAASSAERKDFTADKISDIADVLDASAAWIEDRVKTSIEGAVSSYKAAENGEDSSEDPLADRLTELILPAVKWGKKQKANLGSKDVKQWDARQLMKRHRRIAVCAILLLLVLFAWGMAGACKSSSTITNAGIASSKTTTQNATVQVKKEKTYAVHINVKCKRNLIFSTYDLQIYTDDELIGTLDHGEEDSWDKELSEGSHRLRICKKGDKDVDGSKTFSITDESVVNCTVSTSSSQVEIDKFSCQTMEEAEQTEAKAKAEAEAKAKEKEQEKQEKSDDASSSGVQSTKNETTEEVEQEESSQTTSGDDDSVATTEEVFTTENCAELANLLSSSSSDASAFARTYKGKTIEFDGNIAYMSSHNGMKTRFDVLIYAGDYSETSAKGPHMQYRDVNYFDMGPDGIDSIHMGLNVRIRAIVGEYDASADILRLTPVSMKAR